tara:strand:+ start:6389 stop:7219 length:831 start_codon:yes stop_codon:yes gene_type:complete
MSDTAQETQETMLDEPMENIAAEEQAEKDANPEVIEDVLAADPIDEDTTIAAEDEETEFERPEYFPEKFWDTKDGPDIEGMVKSYTEMEKMVSQGKHKTPKEYDVKFATDKGVTDDDPLLDLAVTWAKEHGISQGAFEGIVGGYLDSELEKMEKYESDVKTEKAKLGVNADEILRSTAQWADGLAKKGVLNEGELEAFKQVGSSADGVRAIQKIRKFFGEGTVPIAEPSAEGLPTEMELYAMVGNPEYKTNPAYRAKVQKLFKQRFKDDPNIDYII